MMKINEVFEGLSVDNSGVYWTNINDRRYELSADHSGFISFEVFDHSGKLIPSALGSGGFTGNIKINSDWELVRKPVDFMTAVNSGKPIKGAGSSNFHPYGWYFKVGLSIEQINGKWEIE